MNSLSTDAARPARPINLAVPLLGFALAKMTASGAESTICREPLELNLETNLLVELGRPRFVRVGCLDFLLPPIGTKRIHTKWGDRPNDSRQTRKRRDAKRQAVCLGTIDRCVFRTSTSVRSRLGFIPVKVLFQPVAKLRLPTYALLMLLCGLDQRNGSIYDIYLFKSFQRKHSADSNLGIDPVFDVMTSGRRGRRFKSSRPDSYLTRTYVKSGWR